MAALMENDTVLYRRRLMPMASAARSESRIAMKARPTPERMMDHEASITSPMTPRLT
jgi:hypothetical protein